MTRKNANTFIALAITCFLFLCIGLFSFNQVKQSNQQNIKELSLKMVQDVNLQLEDIRNSIQRDDVLSPQCEEPTLNFMRRAVFEHPAMSEIGIVDEHGMLICNSFGRLSPPVQTTSPIKEYQLRYYGPIISDYLGASSFVIARTRKDHFEVNALIPTGWFANMIKLPESTHVSYVAIVDMLTGVPIFKHGTYSLPLEHALFPIEIESLEYTGQFDDLQSKYLFISKFSALPSLGLVIAIDDKQLIHWNHNWLVIAFLLFIGFFYAIVKGLNYLDLLNRNTKAQILEALQNDEFYNVYQPFVDNSTGKVIGAEVLMRWMHPIEGELGPAYFIPEAERDGSILELSIKQIDNAIRDLPSKEDLGSDFKLSLNANGYLLFSQKYRQAVLKAANYFPKVTLELTERDVLNEAESRQQLLLLSEQGIEIAIDDFGTGYSGLQYLQQFPIDLLKIDQSFVASIGLANLQAPVLDAIIDMANKLGKKLIAEGVETATQQHYLTEKGVYIHQGWLYSKPLKGGDFINFFNEINKHDCQQENGIEHNRKQNSHSSTSKHYS